MLTIIFHKMSMNIRKIIVTTLMRRKEKDSKVRCNIGRSDSNYDTDVDQR